MITPLYWSKNKLYILNQIELPDKIEYVICKNYYDVVSAIKKMVIRGAPAIGIAAAFGIVIASREKKFTSFQELYKYLIQAKRDIDSSRPTAVNLTYSTNRMMSVIKKEHSVETIKKLLEQEAQKIVSEDIEMNKKIAQFGAKLLKKNCSVLTHCNAGALATGGYGTAVGIITEAYTQKKIKMVYIDETRPYFQGARLTAWELKQQKVPCCVICDNMAGYFMKTEKIDAVIVGADRIAANGDVANKIGTYSLAILAKYHKIPFYVAAPWTTVDLKTSSGDDIVIEERASEEITTIYGKKIVPDGIQARHPAFDVTPNNLITAIITDKGIIKSPFFKGLRN